MKIIAVAAVTAACFVAAILNLALNTDFRRRAMGLCGGIALVVGILSYAYAYTLASGLHIATVFKTLLTVCRMFGGVNDFSAVSHTPLFQRRLIVALFWLGHFLAFYVTASAAIEILGRQLLRGLRVRMLRWSDLNIVYGADAENLKWLDRSGRDCRTVLLSEKRDPVLDGLAEGLGGVAFSGEISEAFLKRLGAGRRARLLNFYALGEDVSANLRFAEAARDALEAIGADPDRTSLFLLGVPEYKAARLQALGDRYGFGALFAAERCELLARLAIQSLSPWRLIPCDGRGRATRDLHICVVGFGRMGRSLLRAMVMNGQLEGSAFHAVAFDPDMDFLKGHLMAGCPELVEAYDIDLKRCAAGAPEFYACLESRPLDVIALCAGDRVKNLELALDLETFYGARPARPIILSCAEDSVFVDDVEYRLGSMDVRGMDQRAMVLNHRYCGGSSPESDWRRCDPFSRASSRASAEFYPAFLHAAGLTADQALSESWPPEPEVLENLARTEHLRWCAFHRAMGYRRMETSEFNARAERIEGGEDLRLSKDAARRTHACLIPWEQLDALSKRESAVTGRQVDYKAMDKNNVLALPELLR